MYARWSSHNGWNNGSNNTCLSAHFVHGCLGDTGRNKVKLAVTLLDYLDMGVMAVSANFVAN